METPGRPRILVVDDEPSICEVLSIALRKDGYEVTAETNPKKALEAFRQERFDVVLQDLTMPEMDGIAFLERIRKIDPKARVVVVTAHSSWDRTCTAMRLEAFSFIEKAGDWLKDVRETVALALGAGEACSRFAEVLKGIHLVGFSKPIVEMIELVRRVAPTDSTVLIEGESGVGKELVARALHYCSPRASGSFIAVNCGGLTETLLESELFGHAKGSFTGAVADKVGLVEVAHKGTLFLDEVSEMSPALQVKVLRLLEEKEFKPVGSTGTRRVDVRFITATNKDLEEEVGKGTFRKDLFYRLNVIPIRIPPLRERRGDIPLLADFFLKQYSHDMGKKGKNFAPEVMDAMMRHPWPGNIRELENAVQRAVALSAGDTITVKDLFEEEQPAVPGAPERTIGEAGVDLDKTMEGIEIDYLRKAMKEAGGSQTKAARLLKMPLRSFRYKLRKYGIDRGA